MCVGAGLGVCPPWVREVRCLSTWCRHWEGGLGSVTCAPWVLETVWSPVGAGGEIRRRLSLVGARGVVHGPGVPGGCADGQGSTQERGGRRKGRSRGTPLPSGPLGPAQGKGGVQSPAPAPGGFLGLTSPPAHSPAVTSPGTSSGTSSGSHRGAGAGLAPGLGARGSRTGTTPGGQDPREQPSPRTPIPGDGTPRDRHPRGRDPLGTAMPGDRNPRDRHPWGQDPPSPGHHGAWAAGRGFCPGAGLAPGGRVLRAGGGASRVQGGALLGGLPRPRGGGVAEVGEGAWPVGEGRVPPSGRGAGVARGDAGCSRHP